MSLSNDELLRMAREAGFITGCLHTYDGSLELPFATIASCTVGCLHQVKRLAELVAAAEREACAAICDQCDDGEHGDTADCADRIRARGAA